MKKLLLILLAAVTLSSCGFILQAGTNKCQRAQKRKEVPRQLNAFIIVLDVCCGAVPLVVDILSGNIYRKRADVCK